MLWQDLKLAVHPRKPTNLSELKQRYVKKSRLKFLHSDVKD
uniref:Uncharacterized protein n=1 Tax=Anguilla anguilla TaxID=7936 RepID=A0A0E9TYJ8_ANGAN